MKKLLFLFLLGSNIALAQGLMGKKDSHFTHQDSIRGSITKEREWWDLKHYHLDIKVEPDKKYISGSNTIKYQVLKPYQNMQIDLQEPLKITKVLQNNKELSFKRDGNAYYITLSEPQKVGDNNQIIVYYEGVPKEAVRAPWDGGISWSKDKNGDHFIASSCQGLGASVWWPNKDHMYDEVENMRISVNVPKKLTDVSNGRLEKVEEKPDGTKTFTWYVSNPINNYGVNINIGNYTNFSEVFQGEKGKLDCNYYVLKSDLEKAKKQFQQVPKMLKAFEHWFGPYPFYEDSYKLVQVPYLGMEHQSSVTYGNGFQNGYLGNDMSGTGWGDKFDYIIIHESGHEWFANNITYKDIADMWIHESFTDYSESLFVEYYYGKKAGQEYNIGLRKLISNDKPIIGVYDVNHEGSGDMYFKGANILNTLRTWLNDDIKWRNILRGLNKTFYHQTVTTKQIEDYIAQQTGLDLKKFFDQYLRQNNIPTLELITTKNAIKYRWTNCVEGFDMPLQVYTKGKTIIINPNTEWKTKYSKNPSEIQIDQNYYINIVKK